MAQTKGALLGKIKAAFPECQVSSSPAAFTVTWRGVEMKIGLSGDVVWAKYGRKMLDRDKVRRHIDNPPARALTTPEAKALLNSLVEDEED